MEQQQQLFLKAGCAAQRESVCRERESGRERQRGRARITTLAFLADFSTTCQNVSINMQLYYCLPLHDLLFYKCMQIYTYLCVCVYVFPRFVIYGLRLRFAIAQSSGKLTEAIAILSALKTRLCLSVCVCKCLPLCLH